MANRRRPSLKRLYADLKDAPANVASLEVTADGFKVTFRGPPGAPQPTAPVSAPAPKLIPGTPFPDDNSPINPIDLVLCPPPSAEN